MSTPKDFAVRIAYACNDLARSRKAPQDILGYDLYHVGTGITYECFDSEEEANEALERITSEGTL